MSGEADTLYDKVRDHPYVYRDGNPINIRLTTSIKIIVRRSFFLETYRSFTHLHRESGDSSTCYCRFVVRLIRLKIFYLWNLQFWRNSEK